MAKHRLVPILKAAEAPASGSLCFSKNLVTPPQAMRVEVRTCTFLYFDVTCQIGLKSF